MIYKHVAADTLSIISDNISLRATDIHSLNDEFELIPDEKNDQDIVDFELRKAYDKISEGELPRDDLVFAIINTRYSKLKDLFPCISSDAYSTWEEGIIEKRNKHCSEKNYLKITFGGDVPPTEKAFDR